jgi:hypothetical protein
MEQGIFISLTDFVLRSPESIMTATVLGLVCTPVLFLIMPFRGMRVLYKSLVARQLTIKNTMLYRLALFFLVLAVYGAGEIVFFFLNAKAGEVNGVMIPMLTVLPTISYLCFEFSYTKSQATSKTNPDASMQGNSPQR